MVSEEVCPKCGMRVYSPKNISLLEEHLEDCNGGVY